MISNAVFSNDNLCRYSLTRIWNDNPDAKLLAFIMLNPSTAGKEIDDPTVKRCIGFGVDLGFDGIIIGNLFPWKATDPKEIDKIKGKYYTSYYDVIIRGIDPEIINKQWLEKIFIDNQIKQIICGWGNIGLKGKKEAILKVLENARLKQQDLYCLKINKDGNPAHPLYLRSDLKPILYHEVTRWN